MSGQEDRQKSLMLIREILTAMLQLVYYALTSRASPGAASGFFVRPSCPISLVRLFFKEK